MTAKSRRDLKLDQTIGSIEPEKLENTRKTINEEIAEARAVVDAKSMGKAQVVDALVSMTEQNDKRMEKLDLITDIQLILVDRFQKLFKLMVGVAILMGLCLVAMVAGLGFGLSISKQVTALVATGKDMLEQTKQTKESVEKTQEKVDKTQEKVKEVADKVPEIEVDPETGEKTVLLPAKKKPDPEPSASSKAPPPPGPPPPAGQKPEPPAPPQDKIRVPVNDLK